MWHALDVKGLIKSEGGKYSTAEDKGYSFCNCRDIFYTDWDNIDPGLYNESYTVGYVTEVAERLFKNLIKKHFHKFEKKNGLFIDLGSISDSVLDYVKEQGWDTVGVDIFKHDSKHDFIVGDVERIESLPTANVIWASHIFEHFKDPVSVAKKLYNFIEKDGYLFVAMPDPWFVNWQQPHYWLHWVMKEHHIMWDMDSFADMMIELGYKLVSAERNDSMEMICSGDYHIIFQK